MTEQKWLLCRPTYFDVLYEINPWMHIDMRPDKAAALQQWEGLRKHFDQHSIPYELLPEQPEVPDLVFTANGALVKGKKAVIASFKFPQRQKEEPFFEQWFRDNKYEIFKIDTGWFEGEGDALFIGETLCAGYGTRSTPETYRKVAEYLNITKVILCEMIDPYFYHLDTCFAPISDNQALIYAEALSEASIKELTNNMELIYVNKEEALRFACNAVVHNKIVIIPSGCPVTTKELQKRNFTVVETEMTQFMKAGGAAKCCSLRV